MPRPSHLALLLALTIPAAAQQIDDPANLMGERVSPQALADDLPINHGAPALEQLLRKLRTRASMMLIVAHPDDEDSGLLTYESRGKGARVAMLTLTRGEGGQNLMSADFNDALGLIRTQELLAEDRYTGTEQFFGTEVDFGFSKTKEESFKKWTHDRVLYDAVRAVRLYRPLVLASVFIGGVTDGHGHHQVAGQIAQEVFLAAADPKVFPEMGLPPWAPLRVYARVPFARITPEGMFDYATGKFAPPHFHNYVTGTDTTTPPVATITIHEGDKPNVPAFNGMSYAQWARQGLALQKTQIGPNFHPPTGMRSDAGYTLYGSRSDSAVPASEIGQGFSPANTVQGKDGASAPGTTSDDDQDLFTGIDTSLVSLTSLAPDASANVKVVLKSNLGALDNSIAEAQREFDPSHPDKIVPILRSALASYDGFLKNIEAINAAFLPANEKFNLLHELRIKRVQLNNALILALGVSFSVEAEQRDVGKTLDSASFPSDQLQTKWLIRNPANAKLEFLGLGSSRKAKSASELKPISVGKNFKLNVNVHVQVEQGSSTEIPGTRPYFHRENIQQPYYDIDVPSLRNAPSTPTPLSLTALIQSEDVVLEVPTQTTFDGVTFILKPSISIEPSSSIGILTSSQPLIKLTISVTNTSDAKVEGNLVLNLPSNWRATPTTSPFIAPPKSTVEGVSIAVAAAAKADGSSTVLQVTATTAEATYTESFRPVGYPGLMPTNYYTPAKVKIVPVDVTTAPSLRVAYLPGTGDDVPQFLPSLGVTPTILAVKDLTPDTLNHYDAVLLGVRAYSAHPDLAGPPSDALTAYAKQGGVVIVQYSSAGFKPESAPFPYTVPGDSAHNVVEEEHPVAILAPENPLLTWPNRITPADFDHWTEERGHGFATEWAPEYTPLLEMHDDGQDPQKGGLLVAKVGKGAYIYCALALYRQLPEGVPGAYRLIANLLSYAKNPSR